MEPIQRAILSLEGLSTGDALGERFFGDPDKIVNLITNRKLPEQPWIYTDDTEMAISIVEVLHKKGKIDPDLLASLFADRYTPTRGYAGGAHRLLQAYRNGADWRIESKILFDGGSYGNGSAMRVAPIGAYFADDIEAIKENAAMSAMPTHAHPEAIAGAIAVAIGAGLAWQVGAGKSITQKEFFESILDNIPESKTRSGIIKAFHNIHITSPVTAAGILGSGLMVSCQDTVPFVIWCASRHLDNFVESFWTTVSGLGDRDTTCAMVCGITALSDRRNGIPEEWINSREELPVDFLQ